MEPQLISLKVHPNAKKEALVSVGHDRFEAWIKAKPIDGRANAAIVALLARDLEIPEERIQLVKGARATRKVLRIL